MQEFHVDIEIHGLFDDNAYQELVKEIFESIPEDDRENVIVSRYHHSALDYLGRERIFFRIFANDLGKANRILTAIEGGNLSCEEISLADSQHFLRH